MDKTMHFFSELLKNLGNDRLIYKRKGDREAIIDDDWYDIALNTMKWTKLKEHKFQVEDTNVEVYYEENFFVIRITWKDSVENEKIVVVT